jgi:hypothetical protein
MRSYASVLSIFFFSFFFSPQFHYEFFFLFFFLQRAVADANLKVKGGKGPVEIRPKRVDHISLSYSFPAEHKVQLGIVLCSDLMFVEVSLHLLSGVVMCVMSILVCNMNAMCYVHLDCWILTNYQLFLSF